MPIDLTNPLSDALRDHRTECSLSVEQLATTLGISRDALNSIENGVTLPSLRTVKRIADLLMWTAADVGAIVISMPPRARYLSDEARTAASVRRGAEEAAPLKRTATAMVRVQIEGEPERPRRNLISEALVYYMESEHLSARALAALIGLSHPTILDLVRGTADVRLATLQLLARKFQWTSEDVGEIVLGSDLLDVHRKPKRGKKKAKRAPSPWGVARTA